MDSVKLHRLNCWKKALKNWVDNGGLLVLGTGVQAQKVLSGLDFVDVSLNGTQSVSGVSAPDGTGLSMPDTPENQSMYPQPGTQANGVGFPLARLVMVICLATGAALDAAISANKRDFGSRYARAQALLAQERFTEAMDELLEILMRDKTWDEDRARKTYIAILDIMEPPRVAVAEGQIPAEDAAVASYRRRLSSVVLS